MARAGGHRRRGLRGGYDYHDPTAGIGGAPPARSALGLRLVLAYFGLVVCTGGAVASQLVGVAWLTVAMVLSAVAALIDIAVVTRRRREERRGLSGR